jgi:hypothetical protein
MGACSSDKDDVSHKLILNYKIPANSWKAVYDNNGYFLYYQCYIDEPKLTRNIYDNAVIVPYLERQENGVSSQKILPYIINSWDDVSTFNWSIDFDYAVGSVGFFIQNSEYIEDLPYKNETMTFRVVYIW